MRSLARLLFLMLLALMASPLGGAGSALAGNPDAECQCENGYGACQHYLRAPWNPTADPCWCDRCAEYSEHDGQKVPDGMNVTCFTNPRVDCYLKRHLVAWRAACSECAKKTECCKFPHKENCPNCEGADDPIGNDITGKPWREGAAARLAAESVHFKKPEDVIVIYNKHFYLVTDIGGVKVKMRGGSYRVFNNHEWAHLMLERAEYARREFVRAFGEQLKLTKPVAVYLPDKERDAGRIQSAYMGSPRTNQIYGGSDKGLIGGGLAFNGFCKSGQTAQPDDQAHVGMRHMIGHALISCWVVVDGNNRALPRWIFEGVGHWLSRCQDRFREMCVTCADEGTPLGIGGKGWDNDVAKLAGSSKISSIEELFGKTAIGQLDEDDHKRAWSYFDICIKEWREPFVKMLADLRRQKEVRDSFMEAFQLTPEMFDERWRKRVTGRRKSMAPNEQDDAALADGDTPGARERAKLLGETDPAIIAAKIRGLGTISDPKTVQVVLDLIAKPSELVRESATVALCKITEPEAQERIWQYGLAHQNGFVRAYAARVCGRLKLEFAVPGLRKQLADDNHWLARAEAALTLGMLKDHNSMSVMRKMVNNDPAEKTQLAAMDALAMFGDVAQMAVPLVVKQLESGQWQLRVAACDALGEIGSMEAVDPLITRMEQESGRCREAIRDALKKITRDDLGMQPENWRKWWEREKANSPNGIPKRPDPKGPVTGEKPKKPEEDRYGTQQKYYGIELYSSRIGFILDTSGSTDVLFEPDPRILAQLSRKYTGQTKLQICKEEIAQALKTLDPRAHFSIIVFNTTVKAFKKNPIPATPGNTSSAESWLRGLPPTGETNYYGGLRACLDLDEGPEEISNFRSTPDTVTFLTDGMPTQGEITDSDTLLEWYTSLNRYARIKTHVIAFGNKGVDIVLLEGMAKRNGGVFVHVSEKE